MSILLHAPEQVDEWFAALTELLPGETIQQWPSVTDSDSVEMLIAWRHDAADLVNYPNLATLLCLGAGVEQFSEPAFDDLTIVRLADETMAIDMAGYCLHWVLHFQRLYDRYAEQQSTSTWAELDAPSANEYPVAVLGYGTIGAHIGAAFRSLGHPVNAWSRTGGTDGDVRHFTGTEELDACLGASSAVVNVLPHTSATEGLLDAGRFAAMRPGAVLVNLGRGRTTDEAALIDALDSGQLRAAALDVTAVEPLPADSPLWAHPRVRITPHVSGETRIPTAAALIAANIGRIRRGEDPHPILDRARGY